MTETIICRNWAVLLAAVLSLGLPGCGAPRNQYAGAAAAQQQAIAEAQATPQTRTLDTRVTYSKLVEQMQLEGLWFASLAHIDALEQRWGITPDSTRARAEALRHTGQGDLGAEMYRRLVGTPLEAAGLHGLGLVAGSRNEFPEAARHFERARVLNPTDAVLLSDLGYARLRSGLTQDARVPLMQAVQLKPDDAQIRANLALYLELSGKSEQASDLMEMHQMPEATRAAVRQLALLMTGRSKGSPVSDKEAAVAPLLLKGSGWSGWHEPPIPSGPLPDAQRLASSQAQASAASQPERQP